MTRKRKCNNESQTVSYQRRNKYVFSLFLNTDSDEADVTSLGRPFHTFAPATGKARPPTVDRRQVGTSSCSVEADLSLRRCGMTATQVCFTLSSLCCHKTVGTLGTTARCKAIIYLFPCRRQTCSVHVVAYDATARPSRH